MQCNSNSMHRFTAPKNDAFYMIFSSRFKGESKVIQLNEFFWKKKKSIK